MSSYAPLFAVWLNDYLEPRTRATVFSLNNQTDALGQIAGGPVLGLLANVTLRGAFVGAGVLLLPAVFLIFADAPRARQFSQPLRAKPTYGT